MKKNLTPALIVLTFVSFGFGYLKQNENTKLKEELQKNITQKENIQKRIAQITKNYEKINNKNKRLSKRFISEINKIIKLKDSVNELDSYLKTDQQNLSQKNILVQNLSDQNKALSNEMKMAKSLKIASITVSKMKKKLNGKYVSTTKKSRTDAFKINVQILKNDLAIKGAKNFHLQLIDPNNNIVSQIKKVQLNNRILACSAEIIFDYQKENTSLVSLIEVNRDALQDGEYTINAFIDGRLASEKSILLE